VSSVLSSPRTAATAMMSLRRYAHTDRDVISTDTDLPKSPVSIIAVSSHILKQPSSTQVMATKALKHALMLCFRTDDRVGCSSYYSMNQLLRQGSNGACLSSPSTR